MKKEFIRVRSTKDITIAVSIIIIGGILIALPTSTPVNILGFFMIFAGLILALTLRSAYKDTESGEKFSKVERFFAQSMKNEIASVLASNPENVNLKEEDKGNGLRLDVYYNKNLAKAYVQLFEYIPYKYEACSDIYEHQYAQVSKLIK